MLLNMAVNTPAVVVQGNVSSHSDDPPEDTLKILKAMLYTLSIPW
jgi:hypothetical protein